MFTDLVGSTELSSGLGPEDAEALRQEHFALIRRGVAVGSGTEVKNLGDGIMAAFPAVGDALDAAVAIQVEADRQQRRNPDTPLRIRIGLATGDCVLEDDDYFGEPVVLAARLCDRAGAGVTLATEVVRLLAPRGRHELVPAGDMELKGIPEPVGVVTLAWAPDEEAAAEDLPHTLASAVAAPLVGRDGERGVVGAALAAAVGGERGLVLIAGEAGVGKTRLAAELAKDAAAAGALVLHGRCDEDLHVPYGPWAEALGDRASFDANSGADQYQVYAATIRLLEKLAADAPLVVVVDDLHWADRDSLLLLRHVAQRVGGARILLVGTYRGTDLGQDHPLVPVLAALNRESGVVRVELDGLDPDAVRELTERLAPGVAGAGDLADRLREESGGNAFFLTELLQTVDAADGWTESVELPGSVREVAVDRVRRMGGDAQRVLGVASVLGQEFDLEILGRVAEVPEDQLLDTLEAAMVAGVVTEVDGGSERFAFVHAITRRALADSLSASRRSRLHRKAAQAMEVEVFAGDAEPSRTLALAVHWQASQDRSSGERVLASAVAAGDEARRRRAPAEATSWYRNALEAAEDHPDRCEIMIRLGEVERQAGHPGFRERLLAAAELARRDGRHDLLVAAALANTRGFQSGAGSVDDERIRVLKEALDVVGAERSGDRALLMATLAVEQTFTADPGRVALACDAVEIARGVGDDETLLDVIAQAMLVLVAPEEHVRARALSAEAMRLSESMDDPVRRMQALFGEQAVRLIAGELDAAQACTSEFAELADRTGEPLRQWAASLRQAIALTLTGEYDAADVVIARSLELGMATEQPDAFVSYGALILGLRIHQGCTEEMIDLTRDAADQNPGLPVLRAGLARFLADASRTDDAMETLAAIGGPPELPRNHFWLATQVMLAETAIDVSDAHLAEQVREQLEPFSELVAVHPAGCLGAVSLALGSLHAFLGHDGAAELLADSLERHRTLRSPYYQARSLVELAVLGDDRGDLGRAGELASEYGFEGIERRLSGIEGRAGTDPPGQTG